MGSGSLIQTASIETGPYARLIILKGSIKRAAVLGHVALIRLASRWHIANWRNLLENHQWAVGNGSSDLWIALRLPCIFTQDEFEKKDLDRKPA